MFLNDHTKWKASLPLGIVLIDRELVLYSFNGCLDFVCIIFAQCAKTFLSLMAHISKEQTVQYILTLIDDTLQVHG